MPTLATPVGGEEGAVTTVLGCRPTRAPLLVIGGMCAQVPGLGQAPGFGNWKEEEAGPEVLAICHTGAWPLSHLVLREFLASRVGDTAISGSPGGDLCPSAIS